MSAPKEQLLQAIDHALAGQWDAAHQIVQQYEDNDIAAWIHAVLHKVEGDPGNARYWYHRANQLAYIAVEPNEELMSIRSRLIANKS